MSNFWDNLACKKHGNNYDIYCVECFAIVNSYGLNPNIKEKIFFCDEHNWRSTKRTCPFHPNLSTRFVFEKGNPQNFKRIKETKMKTKPFNLEEALAGKPCVTREGKKVLQVHRWKNGYIAYVLEEDNGMFSIDQCGKYKNQHAPHLDLFMLVEPQVYCIGLMEINYDQRIKCTGAYLKERFDKIYDRETFMKIIEFTLDEDEFKEVES